MLDIDLKKVLAEFGDALGIGLAFDDAGSCMLTVMVLLKQKLAMLREQQL